MTTPEPRTGMREFLTYLERADATADLAASIAAIVERRHAVARLEQRKAS